MPRLDTSELEKAFDAIARESVKADAEIVTYNARQLLRNIVHETPFKKGYLRSGWTPAWNALEMPGGPPLAWFPTGEHPEGSKRKRVVDGTYDDSRRKKSTPSFAVFNRTHAVTGASGRKLYYGWVLDAKERWMQRAVDRTTVGYYEVYEKMLRRH
jgi:hypothetical protein